MIRQYKVYITPTLNRFDVATYDEGNHVLRLFKDHIYHFIRIQLSDENQEVYFFSEQTKPLLGYVEQVLEDGISLGNRHLKFVGYSNS